MNVNNEERRLSHKLFPQSVLLLSNLPCQEFHANLFCKILLLQLSITDEIFSITIQMYCPNSLSRKCAFNNCRII